MLLLTVLDAQARVGDRIRPLQLDLPTPCAGWTVRDVLAHSIGVTLKLAAFAAGDTDEPHTPPGDHVGDDHRAALRTALAVATGAWARVDPSRTCRLPFGVFPAGAAAGINAYDALAHTWDVAVATGLDVGVADDVWAAAIDAALVVIGDRRDDHHYGPAVAVGATASPRERFLALVGRDPAWQRAR